MSKLCVLDSKPLNDNLNLISGDELITFTVRYIAYGACSEFRYSNSFSAGIRTSELQSEDQSSYITGRNGVTIAAISTASQ